MQNFISLKLISVALVTILGWFHLNSPIINNNTSPSIAHGSSSSTQILTPTATPAPVITPTLVVTKAPIPTATPIPPPLTTLQGAGYQSTSANGFTINLFAADLNQYKVLIDTASSSDCANNCPVDNLASYASRNGAVAAINGSFFCPAEYPSCAGKTNSFDTLLMNKNKTYFNSSNNVYSTIPAAIFSTGSARFVGQSLEWGRDTSPDAVIANYPLLVAGSNVVYSGSSNEAKFEQRGARCFIGNKDNTVYIGVVYNATMVEAAQVLKALGLHNALNLDEGGSTAFWVGGRYIAGPGRNIPNAVVLVHR